MTVRNCPCYGVWQNQHGAGVLFVQPPECLNAITATVMKVFKLFPVAFLADVHGFLIFTPYLLLVLVVGYVARRRRMAAMVPIPVPLRRD